MIYIVAALTLVSAIEAVTILRLWRRRPAPAPDDRLTHVFDALALLTDTTEAGFANIAAELQSRRVESRTNARAATARRITTAVRRGQSLDQIIARESLSESEIRLHLGLSAAEGTGAGAAASAPAPTPTASSLEARATDRVHDRQASKPTGARLTRVPQRRKEVPCQVDTTQP